MDRQCRQAAATAAVVGLLVLLASGCGSSQDAPATVNSSQSETAIGQYWTTMKLDAANLAVKTRAMAREIEAGEIGKAASRYATSRVRYAQVEPLSQGLFPALDRRIDAYANEVPPDEFGGFHRIEKTLLGSESIAGLTPVAKRLLADVEELRRRIKAVDPRPVPVAKASADTVREVPPALIAGTLAPYSAIDLVDAAANVEGAEAAFKAVRPRLVEVDPELTKEIEAQFAKAYRELGKYGTLARDPDQTRAAAPGAIFVILDELSPAVVREIAQPIEALGEQLTDAAETIGGE